MRCYLEHQRRSQPGYLAIHGDLDATTPMRPHGEAVERKTLDILVIAKTPQRATTQQTQEGERTDGSYGKGHELSVLDSRRLRDADLFEL